MYDPCGCCGLKKKREWGGGAEDNIFLSCNTTPQSVVKIAFGVWCIILRKKTNALIELKSSLSSLVVFPLSEEISVLSGCVPVGRVKVINYVCELELLSTASFIIQM